MKRFFDRAAGLSLMCAAAALGACAEQAASSDRSHDEGALAESELATIEAPLSLETKVDLLRLKVIEFIGVVQDMLGELADLADAVVGVESSQAQLTAALAQANGKIQALQAQVAQLEATAGGSGGLTVVDANGQIIGTVLEMSFIYPCTGFPTPASCNEYQLYNKSLKIQFGAKDLTGVQAGTVYYKFPGCQGTPYIGAGQWLTYDPDAKKLIVLAPGETDFTSIAAQSKRVNGVCQAMSGSVNVVYKGAFLENPPFTLPLALPLKIQ